MHELEDSCECYNDACSIHMHCDGVFLVLYCDGVFRRLLCNPTCNCPTDIIMVYHMGGGGGGDK